MQSWKGGSTHPRIEQKSHISAPYLAALFVVYVIPAAVFYVVARRALQQSIAGGLAGT